MKLYTDHRGCIIPMPEHEDPDLRWLGVLSCIVSAAITIGVTVGIVYLFMKAMAQ